MTSSILAEISRRNLRDLNTPTLASITDVKHLSSYNWIEAPTPTIAVPGSPPLWSAPRAPQQLKKDSGLIYIAQNAARHPDSPLEPLFRSLYIANPSFDIASIDIVTDRNNIRKLLSFVDPASSRNGLEEFCINIEVTKNTTIFCRDETATHEFIGPREFRGFGHEFEKAYTTSQISGSTGHHRIISYRFSDLNFIVRYEADGYVEADTGISSSSNSKDSESDILSSMLEPLSLSATNRPPYTSPAGSKLKIQEEGRVIPLGSALEIKTRVSHRPLEIQEVASQLWLSQTGKLVRAYHQKGIFERPKVEDVAAQVKRWEEHNQANLRKLAAVINKILCAVKGHDGNAIVRYHAQGDKLVVRKADRKKMLPEDLYSKWDNKKESEAEINSEHEAGVKSAIKAVDEVETETEKKSIVSSPGDTKRKKAAETILVGKIKEKKDLATASEKERPS